MGNKKSSGASEANPEPKTTLSEEKKVPSIESVDETVLLKRCDEILDKYKLSSVLKINGVPSHGGIITSNDIIHKHLSEFGYKHNFQHICRYWERDPFYNRNFQRGHPKNQRQLITSRWNQLNNTSNNIHQSSYNLSSGNCDCNCGGTSGGIIAQAYVGTTNPFHKLSKVERICQQYNPQKIAKHEYKYRLDETGSFGVLPPPISIHDRYSSRNNTRRKSRNSKSTFQTKNIVPDSSGITPPPPPSDEETGLDHRDPCLEPASLQKAAQYESILGGFDEAPRSSNTTDDHFSDRCNLDPRSKNLKSALQNESILISDVSGISPPPYNHETSISDQDNLRSEPADLQKTVQHESILGGADEVPPSSSSANERFPDQSNLDPGSKNLKSSPENEGISIRDTSGILAPPPENVEDNFGKNYGSRSKGHRKVFGYENVFPDEEEDGNDSDPPIFPKVPPRIPPPKCTIKPLPKQKVCNKRKS